MMGYYELESQVVPPTIKELNDIYEANEALLNEDIAIDFLAYALDFIDFAEDNFNMHLSVMEADIVKVEEMANLGHVAYLEGKLPKDLLPNYAKVFAGYMGLLIMTHKGGKWVKQTDELPEAGPAIKQADGTCYFVLSKVFRRLEGGSEDNLLDFYKSIEYTLNT